MLLIKYLYIVLHFLIKVTIFPNLENVAAVLEKDNKIYMQH